MAKRPESDMTLLDHIRELRRRLFNSVAAIIVTTIIASIAADYLISWLTRPLAGALVVALDPVEAPIVYFKIALAVGFGAALPYIFYQIYQFAAPGLLPNEKKILLLGLPAVTIFFVLGVLFTLQILIPLSMPMLMGFLGTVVTPTYSLEKYINFVTLLAVWMGIIFQTPLVVYAIALMGIVTPEQLSRSRRLIIFLTALFAAIITPTHDPFTMLIVTVPFVVLYEIGILFSRVAIRQRKRREADIEAATDAALKAD
jgi:sec-independent protein translocase protein TatC